jgi:tetratricopeptide (TPR) repeat protein
MPLRSLRPGCLVLLCALSVRAQDSQASQGYDHFYNLEYEEAIAAFTAGTEQHPDDPNAWNHLAQATLYRAMYRGGALESELVSGSNPFLRRQKVKTTSAEDQQFYDAIDKALSLAQSGLRNNPDDPQALGALGVSYALRANYNFLVRKAWTDALHDATDARKAHKHLMEIEPDNVDARMIPAVYDYVTGSLSIGYRLVGFLAGYHGNRNRGIQALQSVAQEGKLNRLDAEILLAAIYRRERRAQDAIPLLQDLISRFPRNFLLRFEVVQMYSDLGDKANALLEVGRIRDLRQNGAPGFAALPPEKIDYLEGNLLFWYSDLDQALEDMKKVTARANELDLNTGIMSWMRLGQIYDLKGQRAPAVAAYKKAVAMAPLSEVGKESRRYTIQPYTRATQETKSEPSNADSEPRP